jgi:hypothetical protein
MKIMLANNISRYTDINTLTAKSRDAASYEMPW